MSFRLFASFAGLCLLWFLAMAVYFARLPIGGLDVQMTTAGVKAVLIELTDAEKTYHVWGTVYLDSAFPVFLTLFLIVGLRRYSDGLARIAMTVLAVAYLGADGTENATTLRLLGGQLDGAAINAWATCIKYICLALPLIVVLLGMRREAGDLREARQN